MSYEILFKLRENVGEKVGKTQKEKKKKIRK